MLLFEIRSLVLCALWFVDCIPGKKSGRYTYAQRTDFTETVQEMSLRKQVSSSNTSRTTTVQLLTEEERVGELDRVIQHITDVYMAQPSNQLEVIKTLKHREEKFLVCLLRGDLRQLLMFL